MFFYGQRIADAKHPLPAILHEKASEILRPISSPGKTNFANPTLRSLARSFSPLDLTKSGLIGRTMWPKQSVRSEEVIEFGILGTDGYWSDVAVVDPARREWHMVNWEGG